MDSYDALYKSTKSETFRNGFSEDDAAGLVRAVDDIVSCHVESAKTIRQCLLILRIFRNLCVQCPRNQAMLLQLGAVASTGGVLKFVGLLLKHDKSTVSSAASASATSCHQDMTTGICPNQPLPANSTDESNAVPSNITPMDNRVARTSRKTLILILRAGVQFYGNLVTGHAAAQELVWRSHLSSTLASLRTVDDAQVQDAVCMVIYNCIFGLGTTPKAHFEALCRDREWLTFLLSQCCESERESDVRADDPEDEDRVATRGRVSDGFALLTMEALVYSRSDSALSQCYQTLHRPDGKFRVHIDQVLLLDFLAATVGGENTIGETACAWLLDVLKDFTTLIATTKTGPRGQPEFDAGQTRVLEAAVSLLSVLGSLTSYKLEPVRLRYCDTLCTKGLLPILIAALRAFPPPPPSVLKSDKKARAEAVAAKRKAWQSGEDGSEASVGTGFKCRAMQVLGNAVHCSRSRQDRVRELGGIGDILNHSISHPSYPLMREWAVVAIRNLTEGNPDNQRWIQSLKPKKVINSEELSARGKCITLDQQTGKLKVETVREPKPSSDTDADTTANVNGHAHPNVDADVSDVNGDGNGGANGGANATINVNTDINVESELHPSHDDTPLPNGTSDDQTEDTSCDPDTQDAPSAATATAAAASIDTTLDMSPTECSNDIAITDSENVILDVE